MRSGRLTENGILHPAASSEPDPTHRFSQSAGYEQAQAETTCGLSQSCVHTVEALENAILVVDRDPLARSCTETRAKSSSLVSPTITGAPSGEYLNAFDRQVGDDLAEPERVGDDPDRAFPGT